MDVLLIFFSRLVYKSGYVGWHIDEKEKKTWEDSLKAKKKNQVEQ